jgi:DNA (cytosine-5)-methyltransferase 1
MYNDSWRLIDLFCGAGGLTLGFTDSRFCGGFRCILSVDNDEAAMQTHRLAFGSSCVVQSIEKWLQAGPSLPKADVVIGGLPCQGFSLLNKKRLGDSRRALWEPFLEVVLASEAKIFVMENVPELLGSVEFELISERAERVGFKLVGGRLNAADYGTPQTRKRAVVIAWRPGLASELELPLATHGPPCVGGGLKPWKIVREAIGDLPEPKGAAICNCEPPLNLHFGRNPTSKSMQRYRAVPAGGNRFDLQREAPDITPACWVKKTSGGTDLFGRLWWDRPSVTIRTEFFKPEKGRYLHPDQHRPITHREAARLMGFPDDFPFHGSKIEIARQIGNAVPPPLAGAVARVVRAALAGASVSVAA